MVFSFIKTRLTSTNNVLANKAKHATTYVFIDEIQDVAVFGTALSSLLLHDNIDLNCTGSNANLLSGDIAGHLSGRYVGVEVNSLAYTE